MSSTFLSDKLNGILMIILGIIALVFPMFSTETIGFLSGIAFILLAAAFIVVGVTELTLSRYMGLLYIIFAIFCGIVAYYLIFNPYFVSGLIGFTTYIFGILLIILGIVSIIGPLGIIGLITLLYGILTVIIAYYLNDPKILGLVVGVWLIINGVVSLFTEKMFIDVN